MFSGFCDMFDGISCKNKEADRTDEEKRFGIQLDSLSDIVCFWSSAVCHRCVQRSSEWWQIAIMALFGSRAYKACVL